MRRFFYEHLSFTSQLRCSTITFGYIMKRDIAVLSPETLLYKSARDIFVYSSLLPPCPFATIPVATVLAMVQVALFLRYNRATSRELTYTSYAKTKLRIGEQNISFILSLPPGCVTRSFPSCIVFLRPTQKLWNGKQTDLPRNATFPSSGPDETRGAKNEMRAFWVFFFLIFLLFPCPIAPPLFLQFFFL